MITATVIVAEPGDSIYDLQDRARQANVRFIFHNGKLYELKWEVVAKEEKA